MGSTKLVLELMMCLGSLRGGVAVALVEGAATVRRAGEQQLGRLEAAAQPWSSDEVGAEA